VALADWAAAFYADVTPSEAERAQHITDAVRPALQTLATKLADCAWDKASLAAAIKETITATAEDAATGHAGARAGDGHGPDAVARCGAGAAKSQTVLERLQKA
jgi:glutamyl-tRNA synthetase